MNSSEYSKRPISQSGVRAINDDDLTNLQRNSRLMPLIVLNNRMKIIFGATVPKRLKNVTKEIPTRTQKVVNQLLLQEVEATRI